MTHILMVKTTGSVYCYECLHVCRLVDQHFQIISIRQQGRSKGPMCYKLLSAQMWATHQRAESQETQPKGANPAYSRYHSKA